jgi:hypothetical protein
MRLQDVFDGGKMRECKECFKKFSDQSVVCPFDGTLLVNVIEPEVLEKRKQDMMKNPIKGSKVKV